MIDYRNHTDNNIVEITVEGHITEADFDQVIAQLKADLQKHSKLRVLEEIRQFDGIDPLALWKDVQFGFSHINDFTHAAVVTDAKWMRTFSEAVGSVLSAKVKGFESSHVDEARDWLLKD
jgi:SpoIIAA-like